MVVPGRISIVFMRTRLHAGRRRAPLARCLRSLSPRRAGRGSARSSLPFAAIQHRLVLASLLEEVDRLVLLDGERELHLVLAAGLLLARRRRLERLAAPRLVGFERARSEVRVRRLVGDRHLVLRGVAAVALARMLLRPGADQRRVLLRRRGCAGRAEPDQSDDENVDFTHGPGLFRLAFVRGATDRTNAA